MSTIVTLEQILTTLETLDFKSLKTIESTAKELSKKTPTYQTKQDKALRMFVRAEIERQLMYHPTIVRDLSNNTGKTIDVDKTSDAIFSTISSSALTKKDVSLTLVLNDIATSMWGSTGGSYSSNGCAESLLGYFTHKQDEKYLTKFFESVSRRNIDSIKTLIADTKAADLFNFIIKTPDDKLTLVSELIKTPQITRR